MKVRILYDNRAKEGFRPDWGFACLIEGEHNVLFDTGADPSVLQHNMREANVDPAGIDKIVLSHDHWDHIGGLSHISRNNARAEVLLLPSFGARAREEASPLAVRGITAAGEVSPRVYTTGPVGQAIPEQAIAIQTDQGVVMITGCAHPGLDALMEQAGAYGEICGVLGGFHGFADFAALEGIPFLGPCHCTEHQKEIAQRFPESYRDIMAGTELEF